MARFNMILEDSSSVAEPSYPNGRIIRPYLDVPGSNRTVEVYHLDGFSKLMDLHFEFNKSENYLLVNVCIYSESWFFHFDHRITIWLKIRWHKYTRY